MELLSILTPAETHLVLEKSEANLKDLMKYTFMDLLLKRAITIEEVKRQPHQNDQTRIYSYVIAGKNFRNYKPLAHEMIYLRSYYKSKTIKVLFRHLVAMGIQNSGGPRG